MRHPISRGWWYPLLGVLAAAACDSPGVSLIDPDFAGVDRSVQVVVRLEDSSLAAALGWSEGVPGAEVSLHRVNSEFTLRTAITDASGSAYLDRILPGQYRIAASRVLRTDETGPTGNVIRAFGDGIMMRIDPPRVVDLRLRIDQAGSLVVSELRPAGRYSGPDFPEYKWFQYVEIYNNSDSTIYLDGMLWGRAFHFIASSVYYPCTDSESFRNDPEGLWTAWFHRFPGHGRDYPVAAGQTVVVALDAVDHSVVHPNLPDLSHADFELEGTADADNPGVPNMPWLGSYLAFREHGMEVSCSLGPCFLAQAVDPETLVRQQYPPGGIEWLRIPRESVLDVVTTGIWTPDYDQFEPCTMAASRDADRLPAPIFDIYYDANMAVQRRVLRTTNDGRAVLQDVNTSFVDFVEARRSPGRMEY